MKPISRLKKYLVVVFISLAVGGFALVLFLDGYYCRTRTSMPQPLEGRVVREVVCHGTVVYLTRNEYLTFKVILPACFILSFGVGAFLHLKARRSS